MFNPNFSVKEQTGRMRPWDKEIRVNSGIQAYPYLVIKFYGECKVVKFNFFQNNLVESDFTKISGNLPGLFEWMTILFAVAQVGDFDKTAAFLRANSVTVNRVVYELWERY